MTACRHASLAVARLSLSHPAWNLPFPAVLLQPDLYIHIFQKCECAYIHSDDADEEEEEEDYRRHGDI